MSPSSLTDDEAASQRSKRKTPPAPSTAGATCAQGNATAALPPRDLEMRLLASQTQRPAPPRSVRQRLTQPNQPGGGHDAHDKNRSANSRRVDLFKAKTLDLAAILRDLAQIGGGAQVLNQSTLGCPHPYTEALAEEVANVQSTIRSLRRKHANLTQQAASSPQPSPQSGTANPPVDLNHLNTISRTLKAEESVLGILTTKTQSADAWCHALSQSLRSPTWLFVQIYQNAFPAFFAMSITPLTRYAKFHHALRVRLRYKPELDDQQTTRAVVVAMLIQQYLARGLRLSTEVYRFRFDDLSQSLEDRPAKFTDRSTALFAVDAEVAQLAQGGPNRQARQGTPPAAALAVREPALAQAAAGQVNDRREGTGASVDPPPLLRGSLALPPARGLPTRAQAPQTQAAPAGSSACATLAAAQAGASNQARWLMLAQNQNLVQTRPVARADQTIRPRADARVGGTIAQAAAIAHTRLPGQARPPAQAPAARARAPAQALAAQARAPAPDQEAQSRPPAQARRPYIPIDPAAQIARENSFARLRQKYASSLPPANAPAAEQLDYYNKSTERRQIAPLAQIFPNEDPHILRQMQILTDWHAGHGYYNSRLEQRLRIVKAIDGRGRDEVVARALGRKGPEGVRGLRDILERQGSPPRGY